MCSVHVILARRRDILRNVKKQKHATELSSPGFFTCCLLVLPLPWAVSSLFYVPPPDPRHAPSARQIQVALSPCSFWSSKLSLKRHCVRPQDRELTFSPHWPTIGQRRAAGRVRAASPLSPRPCSTPRGQCDSQVDNLTTLPPLKLRTSLKCSLTTSFVCQSHGSQNHSFVAATCLGPVLPVRAKEVPPLGNIQKA